MTRTRKPSPNHIARVAASTLAEWQALPTPTKLQQGDEVYQTLQTCYMTAPTDEVTLVLDRFTQEAIGVQAPSPQQRMVPRERIFADS